jgi:hypothetical protein
MRARPHFEEEPSEAGLFAGASAVPQSSEEFRMRRSRIAREGLADEGADIVVCHFLAPILGHGRTPFEHPFESSPNDLHAEPIGGAIKDPFGKSRMERRSCAAQDCLPPGSGRDHVRAKRASRHAARSRNDHQSLRFNEASRSLHEIRFDRVHVVRRRNDED